MKNKFRVFSFFLAALLGCLCFGSLCVPASAAEPTYTVSAPYRESQYYENFKKVPISGDQVTDVIAIALSQLGYHEGDSNADLDGMNLSGTRDFVEYNVLYGKIDNNQGNGLSYGYSWCASFVNWCLRQAGVTKEASGAAEVSCRRWLQKADEAGIYEEKKFHTPKQGDLIFFKDAGSQVSSTHIGLVLASENGKVYTIEGNTSNGSQFSSDGNYVALKSYSLDSDYIVGYATPRYEVNESVVRVDCTGKHKSTGLYIASEDIPCYANPSLAGDKITLPAHTVFRVTDIRDGLFTLVIEKAGREFEVYASLGSTAVQMTADSTARFVAFFDEDGTELLERRFFLEETTFTLPDKTPKKKNAGFVGWSLKKEENKNLLSPGQTIALPEDDLSLWAVWDYQFYLVCFYAPDGTLLSQKYGYYGEQIVLPEIASFPDLPTGYGFAGWDRTVDTVIKGDADYVAVYLPEDEITESETGPETVTESSTAAESASTELRVGDSGCRAAVSGFFGAFAALITTAYLCLKKRK